MSEYKLVPFEPTPEMVSAAEDAYMPFGDMELALRMAILAAPAVQGEPVAFDEDAALSLAERVFYTEIDEQLAVDIDRYARRLHALYTAPQPAEQQPSSACACTVPDDCETLHWRGQILSMNELASVAQPVVDEEIHVNIEGGDVLTLPLASSGMSAPRFVVHVPAQPAEQQPCPEVIREGAPYDDPAFESLCREHEIWGTAAAAQCAVFWEAGKRAAEQQSAPDVAGLEHVAGERKTVDRTLIREVFLRNGFTIKPGHDDLKDYVYEAAFDLLDTAAPAVQGEPVAITDADILAIAGRVESCPVSPWWLKDDVAIGDVRAAVLRFARAVLVAAPAAPAEQQPVAFANFKEMELCMHKPAAGAWEPVYAAPQPAKRGEPGVKWAPEEVANGNKGIRWVSDEGVHGRPTDHDCRVYLESNPNARGCHCPGCTMLYTTPQPAEHQPDVTQLVEALERLVGDVERATHVEFGGTPWLKEKMAEIDYARAALATHRKQETSHDQ